MAQSLYYSFNPFVKESMSVQKNTDDTMATKEKSSIPHISQKSLCPSEHSLASVYSPRRTFLKEFSVKFVQDAKLHRAASIAAATAAVSSDLPLTSNYDDQATAEPPAKRRRFQRRNSKTAAMLFSTMSSINPADFLDDERSSSGKEEESIEDSWDAGLEIAEDLVRQLKLRRISKTLQST